VLAGVAKTNNEIQTGLEAGVLVFKVEREAIVNAATSIGEAAPVAIGINPDIDPKTCRYISPARKSLSSVRRSCAERVAETIVMISEAG
jgi:diaminopimelate decarboxylase